MNHDLCYPIRRIPSKEAWKISPWAVSPKHRMEERPSESLQGEIFQSMHSSTSNYSVVQFHPKPSSSTSTKPSSSSSSRRVDMTGDIDIASSNNNETSVDSGDSEHYDGHDCVDDMDDSILHSITSKNDRTSSKRHRQTATQRTVDPTISSSPLSSKAGQQHDKKRSKPNKKKKSKRERALVKARITLELEEASESPFPPDEESPFAVEFSGRSAPRTNSHPQRPTTTTTTSEEEVVFPMIPSPSARDLMKLMKDENFDANFSFSSGGFEELLSSSNHHKNDKHAKETAAAATTSLSHDPESPKYIPPSPSSLTKNVENMKTATRTDSGSLDGAVPMEWKKRRLWMISIVGIFVIVLLGVLLFVVLT